VILPIIRKDEEKAQVLDYCESLRKEIADTLYDGRPIQVLLDDRDLRGGEKKWYHIKRGVPVRVEVGPRDIESDSVFVGRRDQPKANGMSRDEFVATLPAILTEIQDGLFEKALALREENSREIDSLDEFKAFFTAENQKKPEIHGGFALSHFVDCAETDEILKPLKVTPRCVPLDVEKIPGTCIFTGRPTVDRAVFSKSY
jgi:prolyl-tRNA synthetase